jgi:hypothetical protein
LSSKGLDGARLEHKKRWEVLWKPKGAAEDGVDDILEVELVDMDFGGDYLSERALEHDEEIFYKVYDLSKTDVLDDP